MKLVKAVLLSVGLLAVASAATANDWRQYNNRKVVRKFEQQLQTLPANKLRVSWQPGSKKRNRQLNRRKAMIARMYFAAAQKHGGGNPSPH